MLNKAVILIISLFILSSCVTGPEGYFKKSANNKLFDHKGFKDTKRAPLYNKKYIAQAKQNVAANNYDEDDDFDELLENENISQANKQMYKEMLEQEIESKYLGKSRKGSKNKPYPSLVRTSSRAYDTEATENLELRAELDQIKSMLNETKSEMANYKCPTAQELEKAQARLSAKTQSNDITVDNKEKPIKKSLPEPKFPDSTLIEPVKSI